MLLSFVWWMVAERYRSLSHGAVDQGLIYDFFSNFLIVREVLEIALMVVDLKMSAFLDFQLSIFSFEETSYIVLDPFSL